MTKMTVTGVTTTKTPGQEQYETFTRKVGRQTKRYCGKDESKPHDTSKPK